MTVFSDLLRNIGAFPENEGAFRRLVEDYESAISIVPFIGAGLSIPWGFPSWTNFLQEQSRRAHLDNEVTSLLHSLKYEEVADKVEAAIGKSAFADAIEDAFGDHHLEDTRFSGSVCLIPELASGPVITTNFDHLLEKAFFQLSKPFESVVWGARVDLMKKALSHNRRYLLKLHGDVDDRRDRVLTLQEYKKAYSGNLRTLPRILREIFSTRPVLFLGCSLNADRIVGILANIARESQLSSHYAIVEAPPDEAERAARARFLSDHSIRPIWYPSGRHELIHSLIQLLIQQKSSNSSQGTELASSRPKNRPTPLVPVEKSEKRRNLPTPRRAIAHTFAVAGHAGQIIVSFFEDDNPAELIIRMEKEGSIINGLTDCFGTIVSIGLQYRIPLELYSAEFQHTRFEPSGFTGDTDVPIAKSLMDYVFRWLEVKILRESGNISPLPRASAKFGPKRKELPKESASLTHSFSIAGHEGNLIVSTYEDGRPGAIHLKMHKEGSTVSGLVDCWCSAVSIALQHDVPLKEICDRMSHTRFEPAGFTGNPDIPIAKSIYDYISRWLELRYLPGFSENLIF